MPRAILIAGKGRGKEFEDEFLDDVREFQYFLESDAGVWSVDVIEAGGDMSSERLGEDLERRLADLSSREKLLLVYRGHGRKTGMGWSIHGTASDVFLYQKLVNLLENCPATILLVNDCCHAAAVQLFLTQRQTSQSEVGVIAACSADKVSCAELLQEVADAWRRRTVYDVRLCQYEVIYVDGISKPVRRIRDGLMRLLGHKISRMLHAVAPAHFRIVPLRIVVDFLPVSSEKEKRKIVYHRERWGPVLDHHFFPPPDPEISDPTT